MKVANQKNARKVAFQAAVAQQNAGGNLSDLSGTEKKIRKIYIYILNIIYALLIRQNCSVTRFEAASRFATFSYIVEKRVLTMVQEDNEYEESITDGEQQLSKRGVFPLFFLLNKTNWRHSRYIHIVHHG